MILNKDGVLDGSFKVNVLDEFENIVATGYYNADNIDMTEDNKVYTFNMGFNNKNKFNVICISNNYNNVNLQEKYHVVIEPVHMWMIEKNGKRKNTNLV